MEETQNLNQENKLKAILFSLLVAVVGAVVWGALYTTGWLVSLVSYVTAFFMLKLFNKFYPSAGNWKYAYVLIAIIVLNVVASFVALVEYCAEEVGISFEETFDILWANFSLFEAEFIRDMLFGTLFAVLGVVTCAKTDKRERQRRDYEMQQNNMQTEFKPEVQVEQPQLEVSQPQTVEQPIEAVEVKVQHKHKFCEQCGSELPDGAKHCPSCGYKVEE